MHGTAPEIWLHKTMEKVVQLRETTRTVSKEKETVLAMLDDIGQQSIYNLSLTICST